MESDQPWDRCGESLWRNSSCEVMNRAGRPLLSLLLLLLLAVGVGGCAESSWVIPYPPGEKPSKLWTEDPRTRGWGGVVVYYNLFGDGRVEAKVRSSDGRHGFNAWGEQWSENKNGEKFAEYVDEKVTPVLAVRFGDREERYLDGGISSGKGRSLSLFEIPVDSPLPVRNSVGQSTIFWLKRPWPYEVVWTETSDRAAVAVYVSGRGGHEGKGVLPWLMVAVWADGRVISSGNLVEGGRPYFRSQIDPESAGELILTPKAIVEKSGVPSMMQPVPPDSAQTIIQFRTADGVYSLGSGHELEELDRHWVRTDRGIFKLRNGQSPQRVLRENSSDQYLKFRQVWSEIRSVIGEAIPKNKEAVGEGIVRFFIAGRQE